MSKYYQSRPLPQDAHYGAEYWTSATDPDGNVRDLTKERERKLEDMREELEWLKSRPRMSSGMVLDVGCGLGWSRTEFLHWSGVEPDAEAVHEGDRLHRELFGENRFGGKYVHHGDLRSCNFESGLFDGAICYHVIEHMTDPEAEMREVHRVLRRSGWFVVSCPDFGSPIAREYGDRFRLLHDKTHISLFTSWGLVLMLEEIGFSVEDVRWPFFQTRHHTSANLDRLKDTSTGVSPAAPSSIVSIYCRKR